MKTLIFLATFALSGLAHAAPSDVATPFCSVSYKKHPDHTGYLMYTQSCHNPKTSEVIELGGGLTQSTDDSAQLINECEPVCREFLKKYR